MGFEICLNFTIIGWLLTQAKGKLYGMESSDLQVNSSQLPGRRNLIFSNTSDQ